MRQILLNTLGNASKSQEILKQLLDAIKHLQKANRAFGNISTDFSNESEDSKLLITASLKAIKAQTDDLVDRIENRPV